MRTLLIILSLLFVSCRSASSPTPPTTVTQTSKGKHLRWPEYPVKLMPTPDFMEVHGEPFVRATLMWNAKVGVDVFQPGLGHILVETSTTMPENCDTRTACTSLLYNDDTGEISVGLVTINPTTPMEFIDRVIMHELGHVLALDHDTDKESLMFPTVSNGPWYIETSDIEAIRNATQE